MFSSMKVPGDKLDSLRKELKAENGAQPTNLAQMRDLLERHAVFDRDYYLRIYPDVKEAGMDPLGHYVQYGHKEHRRPAPWFDPVFYMLDNFDISDGIDSPYYHFLVEGWQEGRRANRFQEKKRNRLIVSLDMEERDLMKLDRALEKILMQSITPDQVILWLNEPADAAMRHVLTRFENFGLITAYPPEGRKAAAHMAIHCHPNDVVAAGSADVVYGEKWLETLFSSYLARPGKIHFLDDYNLTEILPPDCIYPQSGRMPVPNHKYGVLYPIAAPECDRPDDIDPVSAVPSDFLYALYAEKHGIILERCHNYALCDAGQLIEEPALMMDTLASSDLSALKIFLESQSMNKNV